jgi:hypothetical protein
MRLSDSELEHISERRINYSALIVPKAAEEIRQSRELLEAALSILAAPFVLDGPRQDLAHEIEAHLHRQANSGDSHV